MVTSALLSVPKGVRVLLAEEVKPVVVGHADHGQRRQVRAKLVLAVHCMNAKQVVSAADLRGIATPAAAVFTDVSLYTGP